MLTLILVWLALYCSVHGLTEEDVKLELTKLVMKCNKDSAVEMSDLLGLQQYVVPTKPEVKCLLACAYKESGVMTKSGLYDIAYAYKIAEKMKNGDEKRVVNGKKIADICGKVNDVAVSDGEKGCERAALIFKCTVENAPKVCISVDNKTFNENGNKAIEK